jgi:hypothetical protein
MQLDEEPASPECDRTRPACRWSRESVIPVRYCETVPAKREGLNIVYQARIRTGTFGASRGYTRGPFAPFGGVKASGYGCELRREGIDGCVDTRSISCARG